MIELFLNIFILVMNYLTQIDRIVNRYGLWYSGAAVSVLTKVSSSIIFGTEKILLRTLLSNELFSA